LKQLQGVSGVLPLLDSYLPEHPSKSDPAWLSMPIAVPVQKALSADSPLDAAVEAVAEVGDTLSHLADRWQLIHRDEKPENLYRYGANSCIGDFGLVHDPESESLTVVGHLLGPRHYLAPELYRGDDSGSSAADLYALSKTLWVLIVGQRFPPPGQITRAVDWFRLSAHIEADSTVRYLEAAIERATDPEPGRRPSMREFTQELRAWLKREAPQLPENPMDELSNRIRPVLEARLLEEQSRQKLRAHVDRAIQEVEVELRSLGARIESVTGIDPQYGAFAGFSYSGVVTRVTSLSIVYYSQSLAARILAPRRSGGGQVSLASGISLSITVTGEVFVVAAHVILTPSGQVIDVWADNHSAQMESILETEAIRAAFSGLSRELPRALSVFVQTVQS
jgi:serine/threonine protein kinase